MATYFENLPLCIWFEGGERRNAYASILAGVLFFTGWWFMIDANLVYPKQVHAAYYVCGILATLSFLMVNSISDAQIRGDSFTDGHMSQRGAKIWLFIGFVLGFAAIIASFLIFAAGLAGKGSHVLGAGIALIMQNLLLFASSLTYKFGRIENLQIWG